jgi:hypothetical protein
MWTHDCKVERTVMSVEDGKECNWCGRELRDETAEFGKLGPNEFPNDELEDSIMNEEVTNIEVTDNPDGSANITMDISEDAQVMLMKGGLQYLIDEMGATDKVMVLSPNEFTGEAKTWELSDEDRNWLFHFGFINAIKLGMVEDGD